MPYLMLQKEFPIIKLIILFVLKNYNKPITNHLLSELTLKETDIDYFNMQKCLYELLGENWVRLFKGDPNNLYEITDEGRKVLDYFKNKVPFIIREKLLFSVNSQLKSEEPQSKIIADFDVSENGQFNVYLKIIEKDDLLFEININVGSRELAVKTKEHFEKNAMEIYLNTTQDIMKDIK